MKLGRCPVCHTNLHLDAMVQDECGRQLLGLLAKANGRLSASLVGYLALFRPEKRDLANDRAFALASEVMAMHSNEHVLADALTETLESLRKKRQQGDNRPLANHNYLKQVLTSLVGSVATPKVGQFDAPTPPKIDNNALFLADLERRDPDAAVRFKANLDKIKGATNVEG